jgi:hypothetical protein
MNNTPDSCVVHLQDKVTPSTKALWHGASLCFGFAKTLF